MLFTATHTVRLAGEAAPTKRGVDVERTDAPPERARVRGEEPHDHAAARERDAVRVRFHATAEFGRAVRGAEDLVGDHARAPWRDNHSTVTAARLGLSSMPRNIMPDATAARAV